MRGGEEEEEDWGTPPRGEEGGERGTGEETGKRTPGWWLYSRTGDGGDRDRGPPPICWSGLPACLLLCVGLAGFGCPTQTYGPVISGFIYFLFVHIILSCVASA